MLKVGLTAYFFTQNYVQFKFNCYFCNLIAKIESKMILLFRLNNIFGEETEHSLGDVPVHLTCP